MYAKEHDRGKRLCDFVGGHKRVRGITGEVLKSSYKTDIDGVRNHM